MESLGSTILAIGVQGAAGMYRANRSIYIYVKQLLKGAENMTELSEIKKKKIILEMNMEANCPQSQLPPS